MSITYLYLMECLTYGETHPIKIGIAKNVDRRCAELRKVTQDGLCTVVLGYFRFACRKDAQALETLVIHNFRRCPRHGHYSREILDASMTEIMDFLRGKTDQMFCLVEQV
jgi:hypothetical protein